MAQQLLAEFSVELHAFRAFFDGRMKKRNPLTGSPTNKENKPDKIPLNVDQQTWLAERQWLVRFRALGPNATQGSLFSIRRLLLVITISQLVNNKVYVLGTTVEHKIKEIESSISERKWEDTSRELEQKIAALQEKLDNISAGSLSSEAPPPGLVRATGITSQRGDDDWLSSIPHHQRKYARIGNLGWNLTQATLIERAKKTLEDAGFDNTKWSCMSAPRRLS